MSETALVTGVVTSRICTENPVAGVVPFKCLCVLFGQSNVAGSDVAGSDVAERKNNGAWSCDQSPRVFQLNSQL